MKILVNNVIPFNGFTAINLFGVVFCRDISKITDTTRTHESIHTAQMKEMLYIPYYIWYVVEWIIRLIIFKNKNKAYKTICFEQEAYKHQEDQKYIENRKHYSWIYYFSK